MKLTLALLAFGLTSVVPLAASAQAAPAASPMGAPGAPAPAASRGPSPEFRARMERARDDARTATFGQLSAPHRAQIQAIVDRVNGGKITDFKDAQKQIDAVLTYNEAKAIFAEGAKMRMAMRPPRRDAAAPGGPPAPGGSPGPGGPPAPGGPPGPGMMAGGMHGGWGGGRHRHGWGMRGHHGPPDAGGLLLMLAVNPDRMHELMRAMHPAPAAH